MNSLLVNATVEYVVREVLNPDYQGTPGRTEVIPIRKMNNTELPDLSRDKLFEPGGNEGRPGVL